MKLLQRIKEQELQGLLDWYQKNQRELPWRENPDPYWVWIAEIMSQQTVMSTLVPYFHRFIAKFPNVDELARASENNVLSAWTGLGYYSRARNVHRATKIIAEAGAFPTTYEGWLALPGIGPYTAAAVASQCFGVKEPVWDGNVLRVCSRLEARSDAHTPAFRAEMIDALREKMLALDASSFNQAFMELGATVCTPKSPRCDVCVLARACRAHELKQAEAFPPPKPRPRNKEITCRVWVVYRQKAGKSPEVLLAPRGQGHWFAGMWDFPSELGGVAEPVLIHPAWQGSKGHRLGKTSHQITHHKITLEGWFVNAIEKEKTLSHGEWFELDALINGEISVPVSTTARKMLKLLGQSRQEELSFGTSKNA